LTVTREGAVYRRRLPHYRSPGDIYHTRFSLCADFPKFGEDWMFQTVEAAILVHHKKDCLLYAYVIMADHAHVVLEPLPRLRDDLMSWCDYGMYYRLEDISGKIKGRSSYLINRQLGRSGPIWLRESFDRTIRNQRDLENAVEYVHCNPVRWRLTDDPAKYRWSSAYTIYSGDDKYRGWLNL